MKDNKVKHSANWSDFKQSLDLSQDETAEIDLKVELMGKLLQIRKKIRLVNQSYLS